ncbi:MAG TPA: phytanoyl-CoA dioxygenase family protein [Candidatus Binataceae bacterium]|nr:phytanoyl-CoA dioxygenase family protein [Candidatus Binataceae bacterium]
MTNETGSQRRYLSDEQIDAYRRDGYVSLPGVIDAGRIAKLRAVTGRFVDRSRAISASDNLFDLDPTHCAQTPTLRRIKNPADKDPLYRWVAFESPIPDIVAELIGPDVKFHHSKLNLKGGRVGAPVEWHQDAAFYPHSNDDVLAVGLLLDDATAENGCLVVLPGSHRERVHEHYDGGGRFIGRMREEDIGRFDARKGQLLELPAGSIHIHHYRLIHWSAPNTSADDRRLLINAYSAADAIPLSADPTKTRFFGAIVRGRAPLSVRRTAGDIRLPPDFSNGYSSIYELQTQADG